MKKKTKNMASKPNLLLEVGCEEIPARFMPALIIDLKKKAEEKLLSNNLQFESISTYGTPRRLTLFVEGLPNKQPDKSEEIKGPPQNIAYDAGGKLTKAAEGFAKKFGVSVDSLFVKDNYFFAKVEQKGLPAEKVLASLLPDIISSLYMPISMKWGRQDFKFIRPIHWIVALFESKIIKFELAGIKSSNKTKGHRFVKKQITIDNADVKTYKSKLQKAGVIVDQDERWKKIEDQIKKIAPTALIQKDLLEEVTYLVEDPYPIVCSFDEKFLSLPDQVLITSMKKNQKYFPILDGNGKMTAKFVAITNGCKQKNIRDGNQRVISARLSDAKFFFDEDSKTQLSSRVPKLNNVQFFKGLGNLGQKTERIHKLSHFIGKEFKLSEKVLSLTSKIALLCKADLVTQMVFEFPDLQGYMGWQYAKKELGGDAVAIFEHYLPRFFGDDLPKTEAGIVVSLADKIDTLVGCFGIDKIPSGSADPYGLRRAVNGIIKILVSYKKDLLLDQVFEHAFKLYGSILQHGNFEKTYKNMLEFIAVRLRGILQEEGISHDVVSATFVNLENIVFVYDMAHVLQKLKKEPYFTGLVQTHDRVAKISSIAVRDEIMEHDLVDEEEKQLYDIYLKTNVAVGEALEAKKYEIAIFELSKLTNPVEKFFEKVLVMHQDERIKANRLALLKSINNLFLKAAEFGKVVV